MELSGTFNDGVVIPDDTPAIANGNRARIVIDGAVAAERPAGSPAFGQRLASFRGAAQGLPADLAEQHDHNLHGTPKR